MSVYSSKMLIALTLMCIALGAIVAEATFLELFMHFPHATVTSAGAGTGWPRLYDKLALSAITCARDEVLLKLIFYPHHAHAISHKGRTHWLIEFLLPEGLKLMDGNHILNLTYGVDIPTTIDKITLQVRVKAVKDGNWGVIGSAVICDPGDWLGTGCMLWIMVRGGEVVSVGPPPRPPPSKIKFGAESSGGGSLVVHLDATLENMTIIVRNGRSANSPPNQTIFFNDTMYGLRIERLVKGTWQTHLAFGQPGTSSLKPWKSKNVTLSFNVFKEKGVYRAISVGWLMQNDRKVTVWAAAQFEVL